MPTRWTARAATPVVGVPRTLSLQRALVHRRRHHALTSRHQRVPEGTGGVAPPHRAPAAIFWRYGALLAKISLVVGGAGGARAPAHRPACGDGGGRGGRVDGRDDCIRGTPAHRRRVAGLALDPAAREAVGPRRRSAIDPVKRFTWCWCGRGALRWAAGKRARTAAVAGGSSSDVRRRCGDGVCWTRDAILGDLWRWRLTTTGVMSMVDGVSRCYPQRWQKYLLHSWPHGVVGRGGGVVLTKKITRKVLEK